MKAKLNVINLSNDANMSEIVIFSTNEATHIDEYTVAWKVIQKLNQGFRHPFTFSESIQVCFSDDWGNYSPSFDAENGQQYAVEKGTSGDQLQQAGSAHNTNVVDVYNNLEEGAINAHIFRDGRLLATKHNVAPGETASFNIKPKIWIGVASQVHEGEILNSAVLSNIETQFDLGGIASADIIWSGGGPGEDASDFEFTLKNVVQK